MEIVITKDNINGYDKETYPEVTCIKWKIGELNESILKKFVNLQILYCEYNQITSLDPLTTCVNLCKLDCSGNKITSLDSLKTCVNIRELNCWDNQITSLEPLKTCINLQKIDCWNNQIISLEPIIYLHRLIYLNTLNNPLQPPTIQVQRFLNRIYNFNHNSSIYQDRQNVHDVTIQRTVCESIQALLKDPKPGFSLNDIINSNLNDQTKSALIKYCNDEFIHSIHLITYAELLGYVWNRITKSIHRDELFKILSEQIADSERKCFTGRFNRTLSVLVGYFDDIRIEISDSSRIAAIILATKDRVNPYNSLAHQELAKKSLLEAGYTEAEIESWLDAIDD